MNFASSLYKNKPLSIAILLSIEVLVAYLFGMEVQSNNPDGVWLYTPPGDGSGAPVSGFHFGYVVGLLLFSLAYLAGAVTLFSWAKLKSTAISSLFWPLVVTAVIGFGLMAAIAEFAW